MSYSLQIKEKAIKLRKHGDSLKEISESLHIAKSTASAWLENILLSKQAERILERKNILGQYKSVLQKKKLREEAKQLRELQAGTMIQQLPSSKELMKVYCALLWWCEGNKDTGSVKFTNSDPTLIQNFLFTFRSS